MKIMIINPNSNLEMTQSMQETADKFANGEFEVVCKSVPNGPDFIGSYEGEIQSALGMIKLVRENEKEYDAFIIAAHSDPNIDVIKEITDKPVVGIGEASMKIASMLGHKFSVIAPKEHSIPNKEAIIRKYHLQDMVASLRAANPEKGKLPTKENIIELSKLAVKEDMAEVIVLGCAGMTGLDRVIEKIVGVPVLDGIPCALIIATGLVKYGVSTSKLRRYNAKNK